MSAKQKRDLEATKKALLEAAKELMTSCSDSDKVTSRAIASRAGVNLAMINYCYGSRDALLHEVFKQLLVDAQTVRPELAAFLTAKIGARERVVMLHFYMMKLMIANFNYSRAMTQYILLNRTDEAGMEILPSITEHFAGKKTESECRLIAFELSSLHELAVLRHKELKELCGIDLTDDVQLKKFVEDNVDRFLERGVNDEQT